MRKIDFQIGFLNEINRSSLISDKPTTFEINYWLTAGIRKAIKTKYTGFNLKREAFEESEKRIEDLRFLVEEYTFDSTNLIKQTKTTSYDTYKLLFKNDSNFDVNDMWYIVNETVGISSTNKCWEILPGTSTPIIKTVDVIQCTHDNIDQRLNNSLSDYHLHNNYARPLRLFTKNGVTFYTDGNYDINTYTISYIKKPEAIDVTVDPFDEYTELPDSIHDEVIKLAAKMYIENKMDQRYSSYSNEVNEQE
ncbi:hypothetical protein [uncultured phage cr118_1]|uniref:Uncharacterized protein n=1 Tax=uncultured phage cr118_1 TaxID=2772063 RepID=A0A7M1RX57_9CAUD|nr:hypothetical protein KNV30_gp82 [uncultured phage cr118_1]QOR58441.1 hypothetical protein [uncultured phage cr118_1]